MLNGHHNKDERQEADLLAYIYGELDERRSNAFESHLAGCDDCAIELAAMSDARLGVVEWRRTDFEHLVTPEIVVPFDRPLTAGAREPAKAPLFAGLVESLLSLPLLARAGVALAAAALLVGVIYFAGFRSTNDQLAGGPNVTSPQQVVSGQSPEQNELPNTLATAKQGNETAAPTTKTPKIFHSDRQLASAHSNRNSSEAKVVRSPTKAPSNVTMAQAKKAPRLNNFEEDEDKSLRLVDLFAEIGPGKK